MEGRKCKQRFLVAVTPVPQDPDRVSAATEMEDAYLPSEGQSL